jgi:hypothetical protein
MAVVLVAGFALLRPGTRVKGTLPLDLTVGRERRVLNVCFPSRQRTITKDELKQIADTYNVKRMEQPAWEEILELNKVCKPSQTAETLDCRAGACGPSGKVSSCKDCTVLVPLRD